jgi:hypothetical protein
MIFSENRYTLFRIMLWIYRKFAAADVAVGPAKGNREGCVFPRFTTDEYGVDTMCAANHSN